MNERIKELMRGAIADAWMQSDRAGDMDKMYIPELFAENFAELIVKDCIAEVLMYDCLSVNSGKETYLDGFIDGTERGYKDAVEQIAEGLALRYGVE